MYDVLRICSTFFLLGCSCMCLCALVCACTCLDALVRACVLLYVLVCSCMCLDALVRAWMLLYVLVRAWMLLYGSHSITLHTLYNITDIRVFAAVPTLYRSYSTSQKSRNCKQM